MVIKLMMIEEEKRMNILFTIGIIGTIGLFNFLFSKWSGRVLGVEEVDIEEILSTLISAVPDSIASPC